MMSYRCVLTGALGPPLNASYRILNTVANTGSKVSRPMETHDRAAQRRMCHRDAAESTGQRGDAEHHGGFP